MENAVVADALRLAKCILSKKSPHDKVYPVALTQSKRDFIQPCDDPTMPSAFGYRDRGTLTFLEDEKVIEGRYQAAWFEEITLAKKGDRTSGQTEVTTIGWKRKYLEKNKIVKLIEASDSDATHTFTYWATKKKLFDLINRYEGNKPVFITSNDMKSGELIFLGESVHFEGEIEVRAVQLLVDNINCLISDEEFYNLPRQTNSFKVITEKGKTSTNKTSSKLFERIRAKVMKNRKMKNTLLFLENKKIYHGMGLFVNQNFQNSLKNKS